jgi:MATE family multidrug resistance protein
MPDWQFFRRLLRFGLPAGVHHTIDMAAFGAFFMVVGLFGWQAQHASNMAMSLNFFLFIPAVGFASGVSILAGQFAGARRFVEAERMTSCAALLSLIYMAVVTFLYVGIPEIVLVWFRGPIGDADWANVLTLAKLLLIFVAVYSTFDAILLTYSGTLKGFGDTQFVMWMAIIFSQIMLTLPCVLIGYFRESFEVPLMGLYLAWGFCSFYIAFLGFVYFFRYRNGAWKEIVMVETEPAVDQ